MHRPPVVVAGTAPALSRLRLVGFSDEPTHDWFYLLGEFDALDRAASLARTIRATSFLCLVISVLFGAWLWLQMRRAEDPA